MRDLNSAPFKSTIQLTHLELRNVQLGIEFVRKFGLSYKTKYPILIDGLDAPEAAGTLQDNNWIGGLAKMYRAYALEPNDVVGLDFEDGTIIVIPPKDRLKADTVNPVTVGTNKDAGTCAGETSVTVTPPPAPETVFARQKLRHLHIPEFAPANLSGWNPETETDVFLVFGMLSENTDYRYCCGASKSLLADLGYKAETKPDSILIDRTTREYLMSEFKVYSSDFTSNHQRDDVDVLVCWIDDASDKSKLPQRVLALKDLREKAVRDGSIRLDELS